jgi:hypothetical protein
MPSFEVIGASVREQTGFEMIVFCPFVTVDQVEAWQEFSVSNAPTWLSESRDAARSAAEKASASGEDSSFTTTDYIVGDASPILLDLTADMVAIASGESLGFVPSVKNRPGGPFLPIWMQTPPPFNPSLINVDFISAGVRTTPLISAVLGAKRPLLSSILDVSALATLSIKLEDHERYHSSLVKYKNNGTATTFQHPHCPYMFPVYEKHCDTTSRVIAVLVATLPFDRYLINLLPKGVRGIMAVVSNDIQPYSYLLDGNSVRP